ncbi:Low affinity potassium transport system protein kup [Thalictrum thalictroides]|uniref:Potassium transporter n=1 Tax=Thalictrum thalictroides TaxID=46969 RepID=A0A7J6WTY5_THATH|nr:Low affinity potassium transport system protein kup [Thalictrum thalictroides]
MTDAIVGILVAILIVLFSVQRFGTDKVGYSFAPIICLWFTFISGIGLYNLFKYDLSVLRAINPKYIIDYFKRNGKEAWISLGGAVLSMTGTEAMFADLGHFSVRSVQISFMGVVCPAILCVYSGQAAYLTKFPNHVYEAFYSSVPDPLYWPTFVVAVCASIIASQAMISGAFAIISQSLRLGCFPTVKVVHTSAKYEGQVYIPEINFMIMIACVIVTVSFRTTTQIGNAYGIAVVGAEAITTVMVTIIMLIIWKTSIWKIVLFLVVFGTMEATYLSAVLYKFTKGGYLPLAISFFLTAIMGLWHYVHKKRYMFELQNKVSSESIRDLAQNPNITRVPGIGFLYSELVQGIPPIFPHFISNVPSIHSVLVFVSIKYIPVSKVAMAERFLFRQVEPREYRMFRCVVRYGYKDDMEGHKEFEHLLGEHLKEFIRHENYILEAAGPTEQVTSQQLDAGRLMQFGKLVKDVKTQNPTSSTMHTEESLRQNDNLSESSSGSIRLVATGNGSNNSHNRMITGPIQGVEEEIQFIQEAMDQGVVYLLGETEVTTKQNSSVFKQIAVNYVYNFLRRNFSQGEKIMSIPRSKLLRVGMLYEI